MKKAAAAGVEYVPPVSDPDYMKDLTRGMEVDMRCEVSPGEKRGTIRAPPCPHAPPPGPCPGAACRPSPRPP